MSTVAMHMVENTKNSIEQFDAAQRDELILEYGPHIKQIAYRLVMHLPSHVLVDDLLSAGVIGLIDAIDKFDPSKDVQFKTYASFRIRGAMLDELRGQDWVPRSVRRDATVLERTYAEIEQREGRPATEVEVAEAMNVNMEDFYKCLNRVRGINLISINIEGNERSSLLDRKILRSVTMEAEETFLSHMKKREMKQILTRIVDELPENEKKVVALYYNEELTMKEVGKVLGITESRVSQIHAQAILRMRGKLGTHFEG